jgi:hypothetical protein
MFATPCPDTDPEDENARHGKLCDLGKVTAIGAAERFCTPCLPPWQLALVIPVAFLIYAGVSGPCLSRPAYMFHVV